MEDTFNEDPSELDFVLVRYTRNTDLHNRPPPEPVYKSKNQGEKIGEIRYHKVPSPEDPDQLEWIGSIHLSQEETEPLPPIDPKARYPKGCKGAACHDYRLGLIGHWYIFCYFQSKCIIRKASRVKISEEVIAKFDTITKLLSRSKLIQFMFDNLAYSYISSKSGDFIYDLQYGDYGFERRGSLSPKQFNWLKRLYLESKTLELQEQREQETPNDKTI